MLTGMSSVDSGYFRDFKQIVTNCLSLLIFVLGHLPVLKLLILMVGTSFVGHHHLDCLPCNDFYSIEAYIRLCIYHDECYSSIL